MSAAENVTKVKFKALVTISLMLATIMQALDQTIANVALPSMQGSLQAAQDTITWVLSSYIVAAAIMTPMSGYLAARYGRKNIFLIFVAGFTVFSMLCGMATSLFQIVLFRIGQGVFGAALVPLSQATLLDINPREKHGSAMAVWGAGIMIGPIMGPTLGGWLTETYNWRWVFYVNLPVGILAFLGIFFFMPETDRSTRPFDFFGFATLSLGIGCLQLMLDRGQELDWFSSSEIQWEAALAFAGFWMAIVHFATGKNTFVSPAMFKDRNMVAGMIFAGITGSVLVSTSALMPPLLQNVLDYPVITTGLVMAPRGIGTLFAMLFIGRVVQHVDPRPLMAAGLLITALSLWMMIQYSPLMHTTPIVVSGLVQGFGLGCIFVPMNVATFATLGMQHRNEGTAMYNLTRNIGASIGVSVTTAELARNIQLMHSRLGEHLTPYEVGRWADAMPDMGLDTPRGMALLDGLVNRQATMISFLNVFMLLLWITLASLPLLFLLRRPPRLKSSSSDHSAAAALE
jgi:MFS transporter, DHA2 family, multidrug resistance protein